MNSEPPNHDEGTPPRRRRIWHIVLGVVLVYVLAAYVIVPRLWERYEHRHPWLDQVATITETKDGHPGDPLNVAVVGSEQELRSIFTAAGWYESDPLGLRSDVRIAEDTVLDRPYDAAPVSNLYLFGRQEDIAYEQPVGDNPRRRHHVRFWKCPAPSESGRPVWIGSSTYDERVGLSHTTGEITHHIAPDIDAERDRLMAELEKTGQLSSVEAINDFQQVRQGRNGGGDPWHTDGRLLVGVTKPTASQSSN